MADEKQYAVMPLEDYQAACNALREKEGESSTEVIKSGELAQQITDVVDWMFSGVGYPESFEYSGSTLKNSAFRAARGWKTGFSPISKDYFKSVSLPNINEIPNYCFYNETSNSSINYEPLSAVSAPKVTSIGNHAFVGCVSLVDVDFPMVESIGTYAFRYCSFKTLDFPNLKNIGSYAFDCCPDLECINAPVLTSIGSRAFFYCDSLQFIKLYNIVSIGSDAFSPCRSLSVVDIDTKCTIASGAFAGYTTITNEMSALILRSADGICTLSSTSAFNKNHIKTATNDGYIYVPSALLEEYKVATNWATYADKFRALEDWPKIDSWRNWENDELAFDSLADYLAYYGAEQTDEEIEESEE